MGDKDTPQHLTQAQKDTFALAKAIGALNVIAEGTDDNATLARMVLLEIDKLVGVKVSK